MRVDNKPEGLRQSMSWLHTWSSLLLGWLLYAIFFTGTLSYFRNEIDDWMRPELHQSIAPADATHTAAVALQTMQLLAPNAESWTISLPNARQITTDVTWRQQGAAAGRAGIQSAQLDASTGDVIDSRNTRGASFLYRFHFELYGMPRIWARWLVGIATMAMFVAIISGVITHKKIFSDFFTFRPRKGQRSWLDAHNATAVLALPFHIMITFSGLLLFANMLMPWPTDAAYRGDRTAYFSELRGGANGGGNGSAINPSSTSPATVTTSATSISVLQPLLAMASAQWPEHGVGRITIQNPGQSHAAIELREGGGTRLSDRGTTRSLRFDAATGTALPTNTPTEPSWLRATHNSLVAPHLGRFAAPTLRWLLFLSGVAGTVMVATGLVLWVVKRLPERKKLGHTPRGHRLVEVLNIGAIAGLSIATASYFWLNRLLPATWTERANWEVHGFLIVWLTCLLHPLLRPHRRAWQEQLALATGLFALLPIVNALTGGAALWHSLPQRQWSIAGFDLMMLALAAIHACALWWLMRPQIAKQPSKAKPRATSKKTALATAPEPTGPTPTPQALALTSEPLLPAISNKPVV
ncbi:PepSY domain-containing protein [Lampropedia puyangensis]|uniref:PepSY domain-containing protein n=1 Tax=Lampropedia puyangensis TaxID=1330072 RepID=A0A4S8FEL9_9BURK|nr:PepSY-associated TM helix domain-containing protein [Lampropedia puyangensis]THU05114.1 PepSY domain-containing protein [Lampropedia puyangensis]